MTRTSTIARRDENDRAVGLGVSSVDLKTPLMLTVDPVTNYLLVNVIANSSGVVNTKHRIDQNNIPTSYGWNGTSIVPLATDSNGNLLIQFT